MISTTVKTGDTSISKRKTIPNVLIGRIPIMVGSVLISDIVEGCYSHYTGVYPPPDNQEKMTKHWTPL